MRIYFLAAFLFTAACRPGGDNANQTAPAEPAAVGAAQSGAEGQAIAEEQVEAVEAIGSENTAQAANSR